MLAARSNADGVHRPYATKTPGRALSRAENANRGPATVNGKGKNVLLQTPLNPGTKQLHNDKTATVAKVQAPLRPLLDRTPFPNRAGAQLQQFQTPYGPSFDNIQTPDSLLRPSSLRRHDRIPHNAMKNFQTPMNTMNPWECDISIGSPEMANQSLVSLQEDDDEVEYMAPNTLDLPYSPPFDFELPNYTKVGNVLRVLVQSPLYDDSPPPDPVLLGEGDEALGILPWGSLVQLPELESSDPFDIMSKTLKPTVVSRTVTTRPGRSNTLPASSVRPVPRARSVLSTTTKPSSSRPVPRPTNNSTTTAQGRPPSRKEPRPATALSAVPPSRGPSRLTTNRVPAKSTMNKPLVRPPSVASRPTRSVKGPETKMQDTIEFNVEQAGLDDFMFEV